MRTAESETYVQLRAVKQCFGAKIITCGCGNAIHDLSQPVPDEVTDLYVTLVAFNRVRTDESRTRGFQKNNH